MHRFLILGLAIFFTGCALKEPVWNYVGDIRKYQFAFIGNTSVKSIQSGMLMPIYGIGLIGTSKGQSLDPKQVIASELMKYGFIIINNPSEEGTLYVSYGESGGGYTPEVSIQMADLKNKKLVYSCSADGGFAMDLSSSADNIKYAISRCLLGLQAYFKQPQKESK